MAENKIEKIPLDFQMIIDLRKFDNCQTVERGIRNDVESEGNSGASGNWTIYGCAPPPPQSKKERGTTTSERQLKY